MKILKPGKFEMRKFVCSDCGCEFVVGEYEETVYWDSDDCAIATCPVCRKNLLWCDGEPYEEPTQDADAVERLADMIYNGCTTDGETAWEIAKHLTENGVTFGEDTE